MKDYIIKHLGLDNGETLAYREAGKDGKVIVLIHGNMSSSVHYQPLMTLLEKDFKVYAPDMIGFGDSTYNRQINSLQEFAEDISEFIKKLNLEKVNLMGWSTGGGVALEVAAIIPDRISKVFLQSSVGIQGYPIYKKDQNLKPILSERIYEREEIEKDPVQVIPFLEAYKNNNSEYFRYIWDLTIYNKVKPDEQDYKKYLEAILKQRNLVDVDVSLATFNMTHDNNGVVEGSGRIDLVTCPVVIIHGRDDLIVPLEFAKLTKKYFGDQAELVVIDGAGHSLITDDIYKFYNEFVVRIK